MSEELTKVLFSKKGDEIDFYGRRLDYIVSSNNIVGHHIGCNKNGIPSRINIVGPPLNRALACDTCFGRFELVGNPQELSEIVKQLRVRNY